MPSLSSARLFPRSPSSGSHIHPVRVSSPNKRDTPKSRSSTMLFPLEADIPCYFHSLSVMRDVSPLPNCLLQPPPSSAGVLAHPASTIPASRRMRSARNEPPRPSGTPPQEGNNFLIENDIAFFHGGLLPVGQDVRDDEVLVLHGVAQLDFRDEIAARALAALAPDAHIQ